MNIHMANTNGAALYTVNTPNTTLHMVNTSDMTLHIVNRTDTTHVFDFTKDKRLVITPRILNRRL